MSNPEKTGAVLEARASDSTNATFKATDADITIQSSDAVLFHLHRKYLEFGTGAFQLPDLQTNDEVVYLSEPEAVLDILFQFVYPRRHPRLEKENFELVLAIAEAAEKYEVFSAMYVCEARLIEAIPNHAFDVLIHGLRHDNPKLINDSALMICRRSLAEVTKKLPLEYIPSWISYHEDWSRVFIMPKDLTASAITRSVFFEHCVRPDMITGETRYKICEMCYLFLFKWVKELEEETSLEKLNSALELQKPTIRMGGEARNQCCGSCTASSCLHMSHLKLDVEKAIGSISPFTHYLSTAAQTVHT